VVIASIALLDGSMDRAITGLLNDEDHRGDSWGIAARRAKGYRDKARQFVVRAPVKILSVIQPDITVVRGNLLGWLLAWRPRLRYA